MSDNQTEAAGTAAAETPRFPMPPSAIKKAEREGRPVAKMPTTAFEKPARAPALSPGRWRFAEAAYRTHFVEVENGLSLETILHPAFWAHVANKLRPLDRIEVMDDQHSYLLTLLVRSVDKTQAVVAQLSHVEIKSGVGAEDIAATYKAKFRGPKYRWSVIDAAGNSVQDGLASEAAANAWIAVKANEMAA